MYNFKGFMVGTLTTFRHDLISFAYRIQLKNAYECHCVMALKIELQVEKTQLYEQFRPRYLYSFIQGATLNMNKHE